MSDDMLLQAANIWKDIMDYRYVLTYGYKKQLYTINLIFSKEDFAHLAGFQYIKGLPSLRYNSAQTLDKIIDLKITYNQISKGRQFNQMVKPRLSALIQLKDILDNDFNLFSFTPKLYKFSTTIKADYFISSTRNDTNFIFIIRASMLEEVSSNYLCCSAFTKGTRNYEDNQRKYALLKKERIHLPTNTVTILYDRLIEQKNSV